MKTHRSIAFLVVALLMLAGLAACTRPIPGSTKATTTSESAEAAPTGGTTDVLGQIYLFATQTALVSQGQTTGTPPAEGSGTAAPGAETTPAAPTQEATQAVVQEPQQVVPTPLPAIVAPTATPGMPASYTLHQGEFPYCIARRFDVDPGALLRANGLTSYSVYYAGMVLRIPQNDGRFPGSRSLRPHPATYTVRPGDTLFSIACAFGDVDPSAIAYVNNMNTNEKPSPGQVLNIP